MLTNTLRTLVSITFHDICSHYLVFIDWCIICIYNNRWSREKIQLDFNWIFNFARLFLTKTQKKNLLDYKFDFNFVSCILSKFSNFCTQINDALIFNTEANKTTMIMLIGLSKNILPAHFYGDYKLDSNFMSCILSKFYNFCAQINDALTFNMEAKKTKIIILIGLSKNISLAHFYR